MSKLFTKKLHVFFAAAVAMLLFSCASSSVKYNLNESSLLLIPLGQKGESDLQLEVMINGIPYDFFIMTDNYGNSWASLPAGMFSGTSELTVRYQVVQTDVSYYQDSASDEKTWLRSDKYIDWKNPAVTSAMESINIYGLTRAQVVQEIGGYVQNTIQFDMEYSTNPAAFSASQTLEIKKGVCINYSRLFVAICRAAGIPSRTVSGIVRNHDDPDTYDFHHEWMEYLNEHGYWQPLDLTYRTSYTLNDPRYAGLVHGVEEHEWFAELDNLDLQSGQPVQLPDGNIVLFHYHPIFPGARYGFELIDSVHMQSYTLEKKITIIKNGQSLRILQSVQIPG